MRAQTELLRIAIDVNEQRIVLDDDMKPLYAVNLVPDDGVVVLKCTYLTYPPTSVAYSTSQWGMTKTCVTRALVRTLF
jgi:hypothetical protein